MPKLHLPRVVFLVLLLHLGLWLLGQSNKGDRFLKNKKFPAAYGAYQAGLQDVIDRPLSHYGLARLFVDDLFSSFSVDSAYFHVIQANESMRKMPYKQRNKISKRLNASIISKQKRAIEARAFSEATEKQTLEGWQHFLRYYSKPKFKQKRLAETQRNELLYQEALKINTSDHYEQVLSEYGKNIAYRSQRLYNQFQMRLFEGRLAEQGWGAFDSLTIRYPNNPYVRDSMRSAYNKIHGTGDLAAFKQFAKQYPSSPFANLAKDSLYVLVMRTKNLNEYEFFLTSYPNHVQIKPLWQRFYALYKIQRPRLKDLQYFQQKYTFFPYKDRLETDVEDLIGEEAALLAKGGNYDNCRDFLQVYGKRDNVGVLWRELLRLYRTRYPGVEDVDRFASIYRDFPYPTLLDTAKEEAVSDEYRAALASLNYHDAQQFIKQYPDYPSVDSLWLHWYHLEKKRTAKAYLSFRDKPEFPFPDLLTRDSATYEREKERIQFEFTKASNKLEFFIQFLDRFPESAFKPQLEADYQRLIELMYAPLEIPVFLRHYPGNDQRDTLLTQLFNWYVDTGDLKGLEKFKTEYVDLIPVARVEETIKMAQQWADINKLRYSKATHARFDAFIKTTAPSHKAYEVLMTMVSNDLKYQDWEKAASKVVPYQPYFAGKHLKYDQLLDLLTAPASKLIRSSISSAINSRAQEFEAILTGNGKKLYFTGSGRRDNLGGEDIYESERLANGWSPPKLVSSLSSRSDNESAESLSIDGQEMILFKSGILHQSRRTKEGWTRPVPLPAQINQAEWQADARLTADGKALLFAAQKSNGDIDLYVCERDENDLWSLPIHLSSMINTPKPERAPFLAADMRTLYFSSEGHVGLGKLDVFMSRRLDDSWTNWSPPRNLGRTLNTKDHDWGFRIHTDGETLLYNLAKTRNLDIYQLTLPSDVQPSQVSTVTGLVFSLDTLPLTATITWTNLETNETISTQKTDPASGTFFTTLPRETLYGYTISTNGYLPKSGSIDVREGHENLSVIEYLASIEEMKDSNYALPVSNLFFATGSFEIEPTSFASLKVLAQAIQKSDFILSIHGHTDDVGSPQDNLVLSRKRAQALRDYFIEQGCNPKQLIAKGHGETQPLVANDSEVNRAKNRRVELKILE